VEREYHDRQLIPCKFQIKVLLASGSMASTPQPSIGIQSATLEIEVVNSMATHLRAHTFRIVCTLGNGVKPATVPTLSEATSLCMMCAGLYFPLLCTKGGRPQSTEVRPLKACFLCQSVSARVTCFS